MSAEDRPAGGRVRLRTLILIRWIAILGQLLALIVVHVALGFAMPVVPLATIIAASAAFNLAVTLRPATGIWLGDRAVFGHLAFDSLQLGALLALAGGLSNPFALLLLAPVVVSAATLSRKSTFQLAGLSILISSAMALFSLPLPWGETGFALPPTYTGGLWVALVLAIIFIAAYVSSTALESRRMANALFATQAALAREQQLSALGGLAASAAHALGSPLSTIRLAAKEMQHELLQSDNGLGPEKLESLKSDAALLVGEAERCAELLGELSLHAEVDLESPFHLLPLQGLAEAALERLQAETFELEVVLEAKGEGAHPVVPRSPEILHALTTLIENAAQFAESRVEVLPTWDQEEVRVVIQDDGPGFDEEVLANLGDPYISSGRGGRKDGLHMGLGIFIAQTLLSHSGAKVLFENHKGARVTIIWQREDLEQARLSP